MPSCLSLGPNAGQASVSHSNVNSLLQVRLLGCSLGVEWRWSHHCPSPVSARLDLICL